MSSRTARLLMVGLLLPVSLAARCRTQETEIEPIGDPIDKPALEQLAVVSIDPAWHDAGEPFTATVYGSEFEQGARVRFGEDIEAARVSVTDGNRLQVTVPAMSVGSWDVWVINPDGERSVLRSGLSIQDPSDGQVDPLAQCDGAMVWFDFDSSKLNSESKAELDGMVSCLQQAPGTVWLDGHCDERGTTEYNLALGQRRAEQVRGYLISQGLSPSRLQSRSYGEERPLDLGHDEAAWSRNRRVELVVER